VKLLVVIPTITGRELSLEQTKDAYRNTAPACWIQVVKNAHNWPTACNIGTDIARGLEVDAIHWGADDLEPLPGWYESCLASLLRDRIPAPEAVFNHRPPEGGGAANDNDGAPGEAAEFTRVPAATMDMANAIGPWPDIDYYADCWFSIKARYLGTPTVVAGGYSFVHHWHPTGRKDSNANMQRSEKKFRRAVSAIYR